MQNTESLHFGGPEDANGPGRAISVSALNRIARETLEARFPLLWVSGEISNLTRAPSGHLYFTLKDAQAQVRCTMWRNRAQLLPFRPENGMLVDARSLVTLYEARGCDECNGTGYRGRSAIVELLDLNDEIRELIISKAPAAALKKAAKAAGTMFLRESAVAKVLAGEPTLKEINRVTFVE